MLHGYAGGTFKPAKTVQVRTGATWTPAKSVRRYTSGAWVSVLKTGLSISVSGTTVTATATIPSLVKEYWWAYYLNGAWVEHPTPTTTGTISTTLHPTATMWYCELVQHDGVHVGSNTLTVYTPPTSTVTLAAPAYCTATISPNSTNNVIVNPKFTISISNPSVVTRVSLWVKHSTASAYTESQAWTTGITATMTTSSIPFSVDGLWDIAVEIVLTDGKKITSNVDQMICVRRTITVTASNYAPLEGSSTILTAKLSSAAPAGFLNSPLGWEYDSADTAVGWVDWHSTTPYTWTVGDWGAHKFRWSEQFPDGSKIYSNTMSVDPVSTTVVRGTGGTNTTLQAVLDQGYTKKLPVILTGNWTINSRVYIPPNARVTATGATFISTTASQMFSNAGPLNQHDTTTNAAGWQKGGNWIWTGGDFNAGSNSSTVFSLVHCPKFTIQNCTIYNTAHKGHGIEINSSGGLPNSEGVTAMQDSDFTVQILNNTFAGVDEARRAEDNDEAVHLDYAWTSTVDGAASSAGSGNDGTVCNNVLIKGNTFKRLRKYSYSVAIGQHHSITETSGGRALPDAQHTNIKVISNTIMDVVPVNVANQRGAIHFHSGTRYVYIVSNNFVRCSIPITMEPRSHPTGIAAWKPSQYYWINSNTFNACGAAGYNYMWVNGEAKGTGGAQWYNVTVSNNTFTGAMPSSQTTYLIGFRDTNTQVITNNKFWGLTGGGGGLAAADGNRILGTPTSLPSGSSGMTLSGNTWSSRADGVGAVSANS